MEPKIIIFPLHTAQPVRNFLLYFDTKHKNDSLVKCNLAKRNMRGLRYILRWGRF